MKGNGCETALHCKVVLLGHRDLVLRKRCIMLFFKFRQVFLIHATKYSCACKGKSQI